MQIKNLLIVAGMLVVSTGGLYADLQVSSSPVPIVRSDGTQELVGTIRMTVVAPASGNTGTISIDYGVPVSANSVIGVFTLGDFVVPAGNVTVVGSIVTVFVTSPGNVGDAITVSGVRVDASTAVTPLNASLGSSTFAFLAGQTMPTVVNSSAPSKSVASITAAVILPDATVVTPAGNITITEGYPAAWGNTFQEGFGATNGYQIRLSVNGLPTGVNLALAIHGNTSATLLPGNLSVGTLTSTANTSVMSFGNTNLFAMETLVIHYTVVLAGPPLPILPGTFSITATAFPQSGGVPSFVLEEMGDLPALEVQGTCVLTLTSDYVDGTLHVGVELFSGEPATWNLWISIQNATIPLASVPFPVLVPGISIPISIPGFPPVGTIGFVSSHTTGEEGIACEDSDTVDTGPATFTPTAGEIRGLFRGHLP